METKFFPMEYGVTVTVIAVVAFVAVILLVHLIRTRSFDHAWRISIITGGVAYVFIMLV